MKWLTVFVALAATSAWAGQGMMNPPAPKEFKKVAFFGSKWSGTEKMPGMGVDKPVKATMNGKVVLGAKYAETFHTADMGKMGKMEGLHLISYDPLKKKYIAFWFDSSMPGVMEMAGDFQGNKLIMVSKPTEVPGMPAPLIMKATWELKGTKNLTFLLESKEGDKWVPMIQGNFKKVG